MSGAADTNSPSKSSLQFLLGADSPPDFEPGLAGTEVDGLQQSRPEESVGELTPASRLERALSHNKASLQFIVSANDSSDVLSPESTDDIAVIAALVTLAATSDPDAARLSIEEDEGNAKANNQGKRKRRTRKCKIPDCVNNAINRGACFRHGGGKKCSVADCNSSAKNAGLCWRHGGSVKCLVDGCDRRGKSRGYCWSHGGGTKCQQPECEKVAVSNGFCWAHGGGKRCALEGCGRVVYERTRNYCRRHYEQYKDGNETMEI